MDTASGGPKQRLQGVPKWTVPPWANSLLLSHCLPGACHAQNPLSAWTQPRGAVPPPRVSLVATSTGCPWASPMPFAPRVPQAGPASRPGLLPTPTPTLYKEAWRRAREASGPTLLPWIWSCVALALTLTYDLSSLPASQHLNQQCSKDPARGQDEASSSPQAGPGDGGSSCLLPCMVSNRSLHPLPRQHKTHLNHLFWHNYVPWHRESLSWTLGKAGTKDRLTWGQAACVSPRLSIPPKL